MQKTIERLRRERKAAEEDHYEKGKRDGTIWAETASYVDLIAATNLNLVNTDGFIVRQEILAISEDESVGQYLYQTLNESLVFRTNWEEKDGYLDDLPWKWLMGWMCGVLDFWNSMCAEVEAN
jgi:hypothetical protein